MWQAFVILFSCCCVTHLYVRNTIQHNESYTQAVMKAGMKGNGDKEFELSPSNIVSYLLIKQ